MLYATFAQELDARDALEWMAAQPQLPDLVIICASYHAAATLLAMMMNAALLGHPLRTQHQSLCMSHSSDVGYVCRFCWIV